MSQCLPIGEFHQVGITTTNETKLLKTILKTPDNIKYGYLLESNLENSAKTQKRHVHFFREKY